MADKIKKAFPCTGAFVLPAAVIYFELVLRASAALPVFHDGLIGALFTALAFAFAAALICMLIGGRAAGWFCFVFLELFTVWFLVAYFTDDAYTVFMSPAIILSEAGNAAKNFGGNVLNVFTKGLPMILLYHIPAVLFLIFRKKLSFRAKRLPASAAALVLSLICLLAGYVCSTCTEALKGQYDNEYTYDNAVRNFGLLSALLQETAHTGQNGAAVPAVHFSTVEETEAPLSAAPVATPTPEYGENVMDIDFAASNPRGEPAYTAMNNYIQSLTPTNKSQYTGMFAGKNLILITAEAFTKEIIDPERTPTLYRLANQGIVFEDFYQPAWGGSTSTGEYSWLTGLAPTNSMAMMYSSGNNLYFTMGNRLQAQGYYSCAYHNGSYTYYNRNLTHENLGYSSFIGIGNGLEQGMTGGFPASDLEMFEYTVPQYIDKQPFSIYYMTISGHASYAFSSDVNDMAVKNEAVTEDMPYSDMVRAYYACNQELEYGLESLILQLEEAGIADNTVIALVPDHYPYGLMPSAAWGSSTNALAELYGYDPDTNPKRDHNAAIIWCKSLEELAEPIVVSDPSSSLDILPTLLNLFGIEYDSRLLPGRDVLSDAEPLVFWNDHCWLTDKGYYDSHTRTFTPAPGVEVGEDYVERIKNQVTDKLNFSTNIAAFDYYNVLLG